MSVNKSATQYAVLIPQVETADGESLLLEVRSDKVKQPGEVCFPGGRVEHGETITEAAVRETCEELGIKPGIIEVLSELEPLNMNDGRSIYPVSAVLHLEGSDNLGCAASTDKCLDRLALSEDEVQEVFLLPLEWLAGHAPAHFDLSTTDDEELPDKLLEYLSHYGDFRHTGETDYLEYEGHGIWGLTARIIMRLQRKEPITELK